jgi:hypothetical protein
MFGIRFWSLSVLYTLGAALFIGVPTVLIPNPLFVRMTPTSPLDYAIWAISILLLGPLLALATLYPMSGQRASRLAGTGTRRAFGGGILSFLSVGCPVCNKVVVLLLGFSGAMTFFNPLRPFLGIAAISLLGVTLFLRIRVLQHGCPVPLSTSAVLPQEDLA